MVKDYQRAFKAGDYTGPELGRIVRMGMIHTLTALASGVFDIDFTSYINNDTAEKATQLVALMNGDEDAFYGKGLIGATGMVPLSDAVEIMNLGAAAGYWDLLADPKSTQGFLMGMRDYQKIDNTEFGKEVAGMFSIEGERLLRRTLPALGGNSPIFGAIRAELGLYPGEVYGVKTRNFRKNLLEKTGITTSSTPKTRAPGGGFRGQGWRTSSFDSKRKFKGRGWSATLSKEQRESAIDSLRSLA
jgi:hypothetical protein